SMQEAVERHEAIVTALRLAIARQQFALHYQPQFDVQGRCVAVEALLRWNHPERGLQYPATFLREAEETGLIEPIGQWVIGQALAQQARWSRRPGFEGLRMSVNVSARQFRGEEFVKAVARALDANATAPGRLTLELTESILLDSPEEAGARMQALRELGVNLALDDFGTGYSSLSYLTRLPLDEIKIDRAFVSRMEHESGEAAIVQAILAVAIRLSLRVVAEGVETEAQLRQLKLHGCNLFQGYLL
ncbi:putative bifunctional diguanylate cyclase/phosphodiesterase, partial [Piscinibacter sp.]|uniref:putative bifunctional diguanylate cyclase/phosphodiesterase n=1 Tax=Piscinibacter sp. TaxID=1903157 RepID=UPI0037836003